MNVGGADASFLRWIWTRFNRDETISPFGIGQLLPVPLKVGIQRSGIGIRWVVVASHGIRLPELDPRPGHGLATHIEDPTS
jgi:hypothetical protein